MKHRPKDLTPEEWRKLWDNSSYTLQALANVLIEMDKQLGRIKAEDFKTANHYAQLVSELSQKELIKKILDMLPASVDKQIELF